MKTRTKRILTIVSAALILLMGCDLSLTPVTEQEAVDALLAETQRKLDEIGPRIENSPLASEEHLMNIAFENGLSQTIELVDNRISSTYRLKGVKDKLVIITEKIGPYSEPALSEMTFGGKPVYETNGLLIMKDPREKKLQEKLNRFNHAINSEKGDMTTEQLSNITTANGIESSMSYIEKTNNNGDTLSKETTVEIRDGKNFISFTTRAVAEDGFFVYTYFSTEGAVVDTPKLLQGHKDLLHSFSMWPEKPGPA